MKMPTPPIYSTQTSWIALLAMVLFLTIARGSSGWVVRLEHVAQLDRRAGDVVKPAADDRVFPGAELKVEAAAAQPGERASLESHASHGTGRRCSRGS